MSESPAKHLERPKIDHDGADKAMDQDDLEKMIDLACRTNRYLDKVLLIFIADTACRCGEVCGMNLEDLDVENLEAVVEGKSGRRTVDFTPETPEVLMEWLSIRPPTDDNAVFTSTGGRLTTSLIYSRFKYLGRISGVKNRSNPHAIRHRVGQGWIDQGANLELVRKKLGHKDIQTTAMFYANQDRKRVKEATNKYCLVKGITNGH